MRRIFFPDPWGANGAVFSEDRVYRYSLWRVWDEGLPLAVFIGLNPSTADEVKNDPTVERMERRMRLYGYGGLRVLNVFAYRATNPQDMKAQADPVGKDNDEAIAQGVSGSVGIIVCGWGAHGSWGNRSNDVRLLLRRLDGTGQIVRCLGLTKSGEPRHPLYIGYNQKLLEFRL